MDTPRGRGALAGNVVCATRKADAALLTRALETDATPLAYWNDPEGPTLIGIGAVAHIRAETPTESREAAASLFDHLEFDGPAVARPRLLGGRAFDLHTQSAGVWDAFPPRYLFLPRHLIVGTNDGVWHTVVDPSGAEDVRSELAELEVRADPTLPPIVEREPVPDRSAWTETVRTVCDRIESGELEKVVMAHALDLACETAPTVPGLIARLREKNPGCILGVIRPTPEVTFVTATPERLVEREGSSIRSAALAGSIRRGPTTADDQRLGETLETDAKEAHEHGLVVDAIRTRLEGVGAEVNVESRRIRRLRSVQHLSTPIEAHHPDAPHVLELVDTLHPTPAVGGVPREAAQATIADLEAFDRGWYAGPIGWCDGAGDGSFAIGIRSGVFAGTSGRLFAGAGIVAGSDPDAEWEEVQWKYRPVLDAFPER